MHRHNHNESCRYFSYNSSDSNSTYNIQQNRSDLDPMNYDVRRKFLNKKSDLRSRFKRQPASRALSEPTYDQPKTLKHQQSLKLDEIMLEINDRRDRLDPMPILEIAHSMDAKKSYNSHSRGRCSFNKSDLSMEFNRDLTITPCAEIGSHSNSGMSITSKELSHFMCEMNTIIDSS